MGENATRGDIISIAAAGRVRSVDKDGIVTYGQNVEVEYGTARGVDDAETDAVETLGKIAPLDIGPAPSWRNLRVPLDQIPVEANSIRLVVSDYDSKPDQWVAVTPPRVPKTQKLNDVVGSQAPVMLDWAVGLAFPCQRPFDHRVGIAEVPEYRILPDHSGALVTSAWQDHYGGGPLVVDRSAPDRADHSVVSRQRLGSRLGFDREVHTDRSEWSTCPRSTKRPFSAPGRGTRDR